VSASNPTLHSPARRASCYAQSLQEGFRDRRWRDELFLCWEGRFQIEVDGGSIVDMRAGDLFVVPRGVEHKAAADERAVTILFESPEAKQFGDD
jgi:mannose-6-phosphate isomerase-like protein (cupin superfamily)